MNLNQFNKKKIKITRRNLNKVKHEIGWKGSGSKEDPFIIDTNNMKYREIKLRTGDLHVHIKNIGITKLTLNNCKNILVENCRIYKLSLYWGCRNIEVRNNWIFDMYLSDSRLCKIESNKVTLDLFKINTENYDDNTLYFIIPVISTILFVFFYLIIYLYSNGYIHDLFFLIISSDLTEIILSGFYLLGLSIYFFIFSVVFYIDMKMILMRISAKKIPRENHSDNVVVDKRRFRAKGFTF